MLLFVTCLIIRRKVACNDDTVNLTQYGINDDQQRNNTRKAQIG